jgi:hypothetical protein
MLNTTLSNIINNIVKPNANVLHLKVLINLFLNGLLKDERKNDPHIF